MTPADLLITQLLEAVEVGDDGVHLKPTIYNQPTYSTSDGAEIKGRYYVRGAGNYDSCHDFDIHHPVHGVIGKLSGYHNKDRDEFLVYYVSLKDHPHFKDQGDRPRDLSNNVKYGTDNYEGTSRTLIKAGLKSLMRHIPGLKSITGLHRITGTHAIAARGGDGPLSNTSINIPRRMRQAAS